jgi:transcriptional regulator with XRE-family HTH domain
VVCQPAGRSDHRPKPEATCHGASQLPPQRTHAPEQFPELLRLRRELAGLSRAALADRTGLSEATIKFIEKRRTSPSRATLLSILQVPELGLVPADLPIPWRALAQEGLIKQLPSDFQVSASALQQVEELISATLRNLSALLHEVRGRRAPSRELLQAQR